MRYFSMFSGIGGFENGIQKATNDNKHASEIKQNQERWNRSVEKPGTLLRTSADTSLCSGWECVGFSEIDKYAIQIYNKHFPEHKNYGDATKIVPEELPDFDMLCGGFPCQSFSIAGKRKGFIDTRGTLFFDIMRIAEYKRPSYLFLENVKGLLSAGLVDEEGKQVEGTKGFVFAAILQRMDECGYDAQWFVLNSKNFGVPQNRERVFIIGNLRGKPRPKILPFREDDKILDERQGQISPTITSRYYKQGQSDPYIVSEGEKIMREQIDVSGKGYNSQQDRFYHAEGIMCCLPHTNPDNKLNIICNEQHIQHNSNIRRLTPTECARLQGFPDDWCSGLSDTQQYKCYGNAVSVPVIEAIVKNWIVNEVI